MMRIKTSPDKSRVCLEVNGVIVESRASVIFPIDTKCRMVNELDLTVIGVEGDDWKVTSRSPEVIGDVDFCNSVERLGVSPREVCVGLEIDSYKTLKRGKRCKLIELSKSDSRIWAVENAEDTYYFAHYWLAVAEFVKQEGRQ